MTTVLILAAGSSQRFGRPKQLAMLNGETLLARALQAARAASLGSVYTILRIDDEPVLLEARRLGCDVIFNPAPEEGMASSLRFGVQAVLGLTDAGLMMTCDQPAVTPHHLRLLAN